MSKKQNNKEINPSNLTSAVLGRIQQVTPVSRTTFFCINCGVWVAWALSVVFGAVSVTVLIYVGSHTRFALYEATHETTTSFFMDVLPFLWIATFIVMGAFAYFNMRHTKCGYRYPMWQLLISSVVFSVAGGVVLNIFGAGYIIDTQLGKNMPAYTSHEHIERRLWQQPDSGRLVGIFEAESGEGVYFFVDSNNEKWKIETKDLRKFDKKLLTSGNTVRVLGTTTDSISKEFYACGVFPWLFDADSNMSAMRKDRKIFVERMYEYMEEGTRLEGIEREVFRKNEEMPFNEGICAKLAVIKRMKF